MSDGVPDYVGHIDYDDEDLSNSLANSKGVRLPPPGFFGSKDQQPSELNNSLAGSQSVPLPSREQEVYYSADESEIPEPVCYGPEPEPPPLEPPHLPKEDHIKNTLPKVEQVYTVVPTPLTPYERISRQMDREDVYMSDVRQFMWPSAPRGSGIGGWLRQQGKNLVRLLTTPPEKIQEFQEKMRQKQGQLYMNDHYHVRVDHHEVRTDPVEESPKNEQKRKENPDDWR